LAGGGAAAGIWVTSGTGETTHGAGSPAPTAPAPVSATSAPTAAAPPPSAPASTPSSGASSLPAPDPARLSLVTDLPAFDNDGYLSGPQRVNLREYPVALHLIDLRNGGACESTATWQLDRTYKKLVTRIGVSDDSPNSARAAFTVDVDGRTLFERTMSVGESAQQITVKLDGAFRVTLTLDGCDSGQGAWLDPVITK
ncbi:NPCBM/NEW2 domain-containing protein, partial [Streptomyces sp. NPDC005899]|uniref:NPCBM/NEW2 domain-containing protein n=1 Tax=Streptomyces sp. NPDC005899 TaxID=3155716 RepID=UPI0033C48B77